ncbi:MAG: hypothetical protein HYU03_01840 [Thaumarchaeota archaeon]|nr:hypothetical protein [Nitrososphaerota archaeon]MCS4539419.1 hypothetical protein [Nitrososphaerota archaeon]
MSAAVTLVMMLAALQSVHASTTVNGGWIISQAAGQSRGVAPQVIACGTFSLAVTDSTDPTANAGTYIGTLSFTTNYGPIRSIQLPDSEQVTGTWMKSVTGALMVSISGTSPVALTGSFASPAVQPAPSTPTLPQCNPVSNQLSGFVHLPGQGTEGAFIYSDQLVASFP